MGSDNRRLVVYLHFTRVVLHGGARHSTDSKGIWDHEYSDNSDDHECLRFGIWQVPIAYEK